MPAWWYAHHTLICGGIPVREITIFFPVLVPSSFSTWSQHVSALCFILFLGRNHCWCASSFSTNAPKHWPAFTIVKYYAYLKDFVRLCLFIIVIFLLPVEHLLAWRYAGFVLYSFAVAPTKRCCQAKTSGWYFMPRHHPGIMFSLL